MPGIQYEAIAKHINAKEAKKKGSTEININDFPRFVSACEGKTVNEQSENLGKTNSSEKKSRNKFVHSRGFGSSGPLSPCILETSRVKLVHHSMADHLNILDA
jgi:hypothetical protein